MAKVKNINVDIYRLTLTVFVGSRDDFIKYVKSCKGNKRFRGLGDAIEQDTSDYEAVTYWNEATRTPVVYLPRLNTQSKTLNIVIHELSHVCFYILDNVDIQIEVRNDEAYAYLIGYLAEQVFDKNGYEELDGQDSKSRQKRNHK